MVDGGGSADERLDLRSMLRLHEGFRPKPYEDTTGNTTIGYGHNLDAKGITRAAGEYILNEDIADASAALLARFPWTEKLDEVRRAVLIDMTLNMGIGGLATFVRTLEMVRTGYYIEASKRMLKSLWAGQVGARAVRLSEMMRSGEWPVA